MAKKKNSHNEFVQDFIRRWIKGQEERAELDRISRDAHCRAEGKEEGIEIGRVQGKEEGIEIGRVKGQEEGQEKKAAKVAINLMKKRMPLDFIMQTVECSKEKLLDLARKNNIEIR